MNWTKEELDKHYREVQQTVELPAPSDRVKRFCNTAGKMNRWEKVFAQELQQKLALGLIEWYAFEAIKLKLADATFYTPDFAVLEKGKLIFEEVKGFERDDAIVKFKVAASQFPFIFRMWRKRKRTEGPGWEMVRHIDGSVR
jgi:hypothetical protein